MGSHFQPPSSVATKIKSHYDSDTKTPLRMSPQPLSSSPLPPPTVYGELSILGYNGLIPNNERTGRRNKSKYLLCKRPQANGIKKSRHYIVKQPQATRAIQDKDLHSISYTFSRSQTIIVEYKQDETTDMFQIGRSSEDPIDFVVMDTVPAGCSSLADNNISASCSSHSRHRHGSKHNQSTSNATAATSSMSESQIIRSDPLGMSRFHSHLAKVGEEIMQYGFPPSAHDLRAGRPHTHHGQHSVLLNYPPPNISNMAPFVANQIYYPDPSSPIYNFPPPGGSRSNHLQHIAHIGAHSASNSASFIQPRQDSSSRDQNNSRHSNGNNMLCKRSHTTQSTISRFACRVLVDRDPPYTARIYAAGFDSSKNIFLGEKATKWEQNNSIDGLTTNGVLLMHPKRGFFQDQTEKVNLRSGDENDPDVMDVDNDMRDCSNEKEPKSSSQEPESGALFNQDGHSKRNSFDRSKQNNDSNNNGRADESETSTSANFQYGGVWREVSVDGGIYAIRESRSAIQKGRRIESETNILQDGTLIDLCGATLLWRSLEGFKTSPTKKSLEEKIDLLNASRPQCPVGLNTLVIPRRPVIPGLGHVRGHNHHHHHRKDVHSYAKDGSGDEKSSHQPYVYLKCGHVQGYHDWGITEKSNQRTCPICLSVGHVARLSMGLEPSFYVDSGPLTHVFNPCGHMASERTIKYWCSVSIPHGTHFFHSICPFCATPLSTSELPSTKLIFQEDSD